LSFPSRILRPGENYVLIPLGKCYFVLGGAAEDCSFSCVFRAARLSSVNQGRVQASPGASRVKPTTNIRQIYLIRTIQARRDL
jgi:hypothetical protein